MNGNPERASNDAESRCILNSWHEWEIHEGERRIVLCLETGLELRPGYPAFSAARLDELMEDARGLMRSSASPVDSLRIVPARWTL